MKKFIITWFIILMLLPASVWAATNSCISCCFPIYNDPGDIFTAKTPFPLLKWSGLIKPAQPLTFTGPIVFSLSVSSDTDIFTVALDPSLLIMNGLKRQYSNIAAISAGGIYWLEFAPHNGGILVSLKAYGSGLLNATSDMRVSLTVDQSTYCVFTLWKPVITPPGWHQYGLKK